MHACSRHCALILQDESAYVCDGLAIEAADAPLRCQRASEPLPLRTQPDCKTAILSDAVLTKVQHILQVRCCDVEAHAQHFCRHGAALRISDTALSGGSAECRTIRDVQCLVVSDWASLPIFVHLYGQFVASR